MRTLIAYLWIELVQTRYSLLDIAVVDGVLDLPPLDDLGVLRRFLQVGLLGELLCRFGVSFHHKVVEDQRVDIATDC